MVGTDSKNKEKKYWILFGLIIGIGLVARIILSIQLGNKSIWPDTAYYLQNAQNILSGKGYDPYYLRGPLYSYFIAFLFTILPNTVITIRIVQSLLWVGIISLFYFISLYLFRKKRISLIIVALLSLHPLLIYISSVVLSETLYILIYSLMLACLYVYRSNRKILVLILSGFCLGLTFFCRSAAFSFLPLIIIWIAIYNRKKIYRMIIHPIVFLGGFFIVAVPYIIQIHDNLGTWVLDGYGTQYLWMCTVHPLSGFSDNLIENPAEMTDSQLEKVKKYTPPIAADYTLGERNRLYREALLKYIRENPGGYIYKSLGKVLNNFSLTISTHTKVIDEQSFIVKFGTFLSLGIVYVFFLIGLAVLKDNTIKFFPVLTVLLGSLIVFTIYHSRLRYTLSIFPVIIIFSSYGFNLVCTKLRKFVM